MQTHTLQRIIFHRFLRLVPEPKTSIRRLAIFFLSLTATAHSPTPATGRRPTASHFAPLLCCLCLRSSKSSGLPAIPRRPEAANAATTSLLLRSGGVHFFQVGP